MGVRIDKYLWAVRIFKTRSMAIDAIKGGKVKLEGDNVKPARDVKEGETYTIQLSQIQKTIRVKALLENRVAAKDVNLYMEDLTPESEYKSIDRMKETRFVWRDRGTGRPTKKERRDIEEWFDEDSEKKVE
ncbi:MAG TPA: S4 domain-containing protein [Flavobacteriales bacterium]|nr:S4 domain-containing protein [Flavobacteriales bacterium]HPH83255.1 S4 domain-containing protein [Flavobacteriales bacterium]